MFHPDTIRRLSTGAIDTDYYAAEAVALRQAAWRQAWSWLSGRLHRHHDAGAPLIHGRHRPI